MEDKKQVKDKDMEEEEEEDKQETKDHDEVCVFSVPQVTTTNYLVYCFYVSGFEKHGKRGGGTEEERGRAGKNMTNIIIKYLS